MKHFSFFIVLFLLCCGESFSQSILDLYPDYFGSFGAFNPEDIERINGNEASILKYNQEKFEMYKDSIENPEAIRRVEIQFTSQLDLQKAFDDLKMFPNLYYLELSNLKFLSGPVYLDMPKDFSGVKGVEFLHLWGDLGWDLSQLSNKLEGLTNLKHLAIMGLAKEKFSQFDLEKLKRLEGLFISGGKGISIPDNIGKLENLESLIISADQYPDFKEQFLKLRNLPSLRELRLEFMTLKDEDHEVFNDFNALERLELRNVKVKDLSKLMKAFPAENHLKRLDIFGSESQSFSEGISRFGNLEHLRLERLGDSVGFPEDIFELKDLKVLMLSDHDNFTRLSSKIKNLQQLEKLTLYHNALQTLPEEIGALENLQYLNISNNELEALPPGLANLSSLETLIADRNQFKSLPESTGRLINLKELNLGSNRLQSLPESFANLTNLQSLKLNENDLRRLPAQFGSLKKLKELQLDQNLLEELPSSFSNLESLQILSLRNNHLFSLPSFKNLRALSEFIVSNHPAYAHISHFDPLLNRTVIDSSRAARKTNMISRLPPGFAHLENLKKIDISENPIDTEALWEEIKKLRSADYWLKVENSGIKFLPEEGWENILAGNLDLRNNQIKSLPPDIVNAPFLSSFDISSNPFFLSGRYETKEKLAVVLFEAGHLPQNELKRNAGTAKAYLDLGYQQKNAEGQLGYIEKAFEMDSSYTTANIKKPKYAEALLEEGHYRRAIEIFTQAIQQDTASNIRILNFTVPLFENRAEAYLQEGDTLAAINDLRVVSEKFSAGKWGEAGLLARKIEEDSLAAVLFRSGVDEYETQIKWNEENDRVNFGYHLSKLELFIIAEEFKKAKEYYQQLLQEEVTPLRNQILLEYFGLILRVISEEFSGLEVEQFRQKVSDGELRIAGWSFDLFQKWLYQNDLPQKQVSKMEELTGILKN